jgi:hypothetical protein
MAGDLDSGEMKGGDKNQPKRMRSYLHLTRTDVF